MKKNLLLLGLALVVGSFSFIACEEDDDDEATPVIEGCTDYTATNYDSDATVDDGSCEYEGEAIFWTDWDYGVGNISVYVEGSYVGQITGYWEEEPDCGADYSVTITREPGTYDFTAEAEDGTSWDHFVNIDKNECSTMRLYVSKGMGQAEQSKSDGAYYGKPTPLKPLN